MFRLTKITSVSSSRPTQLLRLRSLSSSQRSFASDREDKPFTKDFNRALRNQKKEPDELPSKPPVDWSADQSFFPGARDAVEKNLASSSSPPSSSSLISSTSTGEKLITGKSDKKKAPEEKPQEPTLEPADEFDPPEKPSHGKLNTVYVTDEHTMASKGIVPGMKAQSPEDDPLDKSIQWEDFKREEIDQILRHMDSWRGQTHKHGNRYANAYAIYEDNLNKADIPYLHHIQTTNEREIGAASDDDIDMMLTENRKARLQNESMMTYDEFLDNVKLTKKYPEAEIEAERARYHKEHDERLRLLALREPPSPTSQAYRMATRKKAIWNLKDPRLDDLIPPVNAGHYTYQDWEHELRTNALQRYLKNANLSPVAERALNIKLELSKKKKVLGNPEQLSKYVDLGSTVKPLKEYHQKMLRIYGAHFELGEPRPPVPMDEQLETGLSAAIMTASDWVEPDKSSTSAQLEEFKQSWNARVSDDPEFDEEEQERLVGDLTGQGYKRAQAKLVLSDGDDLSADALAAEKRALEGLQKAEELDEQEEEAEEDDEEGGDAKDAPFKKHDAKIRSAEAGRLKKLWAKGYQEPKTYAAYMKLLWEIDAPEKANVNYMNLNQSLNIMGRHPDPRFSEGNETEMQVDLPDTTVYPEQPADKRDIKDTHMFPVVLEDWEKMKFETKQHDELPKALQTYFNPQLKRGNEEERTMLENLDPGMQFIGAYTTPPSPFPQPRIFHLSSDVKEAIWRFNRMDARKYHSRKLAAMFGLSLIRVQSVLRLQYLEEQIAQEIGYDSELELFENEVEEECEITPAQWDPEFFNEFSKKNGNFAGRQQYVDEGDMAILKRIERQRVSRYWNEYEMDIVLEQNSRKHAYGALDTPLPDPVQLSSQKNPKQRYPVVMTEIGDRRNGNFRIAVRDKQGVLREPDDAEFRRVRRRERGDKDYFNHVPYQFGETI